VSCEVPEELAADADRDLLLAVFQNLLSNAIKYGRDRGRVRVYAEAEAPPGTHRIHVWNEGRGFDPDAAGRLFRKFSRLAASGEDTRSGTGLGLFVSARIVEKHGGSIRAASIPGEWADFIVSLPGEAPASG
jgi:signal transduction histidine kinase